jgi:hypothetical protein
MPQRGDNVVDVRVLNSENNTFYYFTAREDRLREFYQFIVRDRHVEHGPWMPGMSYAASFGIKAIFCRFPEKFPAVDTLNWLRDNQKQYLGEYPNPTITVPEIEGALERFAPTVPQLYQDGSGDEIRTEPNEATV